MVWHLEAYLVGCAITVVSEEVPAVVLAAGAVVATEENTVVTADTADMEDPVDTVDTAGTADMAEVARHATDATVAPRAGAVAETGDAPLKE